MLCVSYCIAHIICSLGYIFMGSACREWVHVPPALACLDIPSTLAMLTEPALKRDAWRVLQPHSH